MQPAAGPPGLPWHMRALPQLRAPFAAPALALLMGVAAAAAQPAPQAPPAVPPSQVQTAPPDSQPPPPVPPQAAPDAAAAPVAAVIPPPILKIAGASGLVLHAILPTATADFELVMSKFFDAVALVGDAAQKAVVAGWKVSRVNEGAPGGVNALYAFVIDPVVPDADYSGTFIFEMIYKAFPTEAPDLHRKFAAAYAGPRHVLTLTPLLPAPVAPAVPPPAPK